MAGGGVKAGYTHGETDDFSFGIVKDPVHMHDLHATLLHLMGIDHEKLTLPLSGTGFQAHGCERQGHPAAVELNRVNIVYFLGRLHVVVLHLRLAFCS